jgi:hypothetical protein
MLPIYGQASVPTSALSLFAQGTSQFHNPKSVMQRIPVELDLVTVFSPPVLLSTKLFSIMDRTSLAASVVLELANFTRVSRILFTNGSYITSGNRGAAIGSGYATQGTSSVIEIVFSNGSYITSSNIGAGIGSGYAYDRNSAAIQVSFNNGSYNASGSNCAVI